MTPYQQTKAAGIRSAFYSPNGIDKIEEFDNGERFLHSPAIGYPVKLANLATVNAWRDAHEKKSRP